MGSSEPGRLSGLRGLARPAHVILIVLLSGFTLAAFLTPGDRHGGINQYKRSKFVDMVEGRANKPFVYRTLLPSAVRLVTHATPESLRARVAAAVERAPAGRAIFERLKWETSAAYAYFVATALMWVGFLGFAYFAAGLVMHTCGIEETMRRRTALSAVALLGLPAFFVSSSYIYDPATLVLFTATALFLARGEMRRFLVSFAFACINKETAIVLIPMAGVLWWKRYPRARYWGMMAALAVIYVTIKSSISYAFRENPGRFVESHFVDSNLQALASGWRFGDLVVWLVLVGLVTYRWRSKPFFLRVALISTAIPLAGLATFLGGLDEWRGYYEVYPVALALAVDSVIRVRRDLRAAAPAGSSGRRPPGSR
ncbi:MAG: hypothetical protein WAW06_00030 [bacterium]